MDSLSPYLYGWFLLSMLVGSIAKARGRSFWRFLFISLLISPLLAFIFVVAIPVQKQESMQVIASVDSEAEVDLVACPFCAEQIKKQATICRFCHSDVGSVFAQERQMAELAQAKAEEQNRQIIEAEALEERLRFEEEERLKSEAKAKRRAFYFSWKGATLFTVIVLLVSIWPVRQYLLEQTLDSQISAIEAKHGNLLKVYPECRSHDGVSNVKFAENPSNLGAELTWTVSSRYLTEESVRNDWWNKCVSKLLPRGYFIQQKIEFKKANFQYQTGTMVTDSVNEVSVSWNKKLNQVSVSRDMNWLAYIRDDLSLTLK